MIEFSQRSIRAAIFDMDGTMFDTERLRFQTIRQASCEIHGEPIAEDVLVGSLGLSAVRAEALARAHHGEDYPYRRIRERADELELAHVRQHGVPIKTGLHSVLERLRGNGLRLAVATSSRRAIALEYLINANVLKYFDITVCGDEVERGKPDPEIFLKAAAALNCRIEDCLVVEDSENGLRAAQAAGGLPVYVRDIKDPAPDVLDGAFRRYGAMLEFLDELRACTRVLPPPRLFDAFPATHNHVTVGIHGFGAIGGGFLAQIFSHWDGYTRPRRLIGVTGNAMIRDLVNAFGKYTIRYDEHAFDQTIDDVELIDSADHDAVVDMYVHSGIVGLSMPENGVRQQAGTIADGLIARHRAGGVPLVILTILNKVAGGDFTRRCVREALLARTDPETAEAILSRTGFPEAVVNRIVSRVTREALKRQARIKLAAFEEMDRGIFARAAQMPFAPSGGDHLDPRARHRLQRASQMARAVQQLHLILFHSEPDMLVHSEKGYPILRELRQIRLVDDIRQTQILKNRLWNGPHAILAWYAHLLGYQTIGQAMGDTRISRLLQRLIHVEIAPALRPEIPDLAADLQGFIQTFVDRCRSSFKDPCVRVGRDPLRKLQRQERVLASIDAARRVGCPSDALEFGVALALRYALGQPEDRESRLIAEIHARNGDIRDVLTRKAPLSGRAFPGLDPEHDAELIARIARQFARTAQPVEFDQP